jgi:hypothetical protein
LDRWENFFNKNSEFLSEYLNGLAPESSIFEGEEYDGNESE